MARDYELNFWIAPYFSVKREPAHHTKESEPHRGAQYPTIQVKAQDFNDALRQARSILVGIKFDERICTAEIVSVTQVKS